jgi:5-methylcytosine-specific restriction enzyme A
MSRSVEEWIGKDDNSDIPTRVKVRIFDRAGGHCEACTRKVFPGQWDIDHRVALINGGSNRESNLQLLCKVPCHSRKTRSDVAEKSKTARVRKSSLGVKKPRTIRAWRKFDGTPVYASRDRD